MLCRLFFLSNEIVYTPRRPRERNRRSLAKVSRRKRRPRDRQGLPQVFYNAFVGFFIEKQVYTSSPVFDGWWWGIIFYALLFLPCLPIYFRLLLKKFAWHPDFEVTETIITWSDGSKTKTDDALVTGLLSFLIFLMRMLIDFFIAFFISPLNMFIILPYKAKQIRDQFDVKGGRFILGNLIFILIIIGSMVAMIGFMIVKWAPEAIQEAYSSASAAVSA